MVVSGIRMAGPLAGAHLTGVRVDVPALIALAEFPDTTPRAIAGVLARLINTGELPQGARLPTVRELASELAVSPATVSQAWQALSRAGLIESRGRARSGAARPAAAHPC
jgi:DNA-binding FadR family transcriptional regulator